MTPPKRRVQRPHQKHRRRERDVPQWVKHWPADYRPGTTVEYRMAIEAGWPGRVDLNSDLSSWAPGELQEAWGR